MENLLIDIKSRIEDLIKTIICCTLVILIAGMLFFVTIRDKIEYAENHIVTAITAEDALDSIYIEHLKECSMISKNDVLIDKNGYFYSAYWKKYK